MASACINHIQPTTQYSSTTNFTNWFTNNSQLSITTTHQQPNTFSSSTSTSSSSLPNMNAVDFNQQQSSSSGNYNASDFNFQLSDNTVAMLPADELFSDGKLLPLDFPTLKPSPNASVFPDAKGTLLPQKELENLQENPNLFSPKAPRCSSRLKELLGFRKKTTTTNTTSSSNKSIKQLLYKNISKTTSSSSNTDASSSLNSPLLKHSSLSSSSSDNQDDHPRHSLDSEKPNSQPTKPAGPKLRPVRAKQTQTTPPAPMMESPRMNPSGRVVFEGLERSTSCPSSFNGGTKSYKGTTSLIERSYSVNVNNRITPVLNVPVCSIRGSSKLMGFGQLFTSQKKDGVSVGYYYGGGTNYKTNHHHSHFNGSKNKKEKEKIKESK